jgi:hypothetical protein
MGNCARLNWHIDQVFHSIFDRFFNCRWHFVGLCVPAANPPPTVSDDHKARKTKSTAAFYDRGATPHFHDFFSEFTASGFLAARSARLPSLGSIGGAFGAVCWVCHYGFSFPLKF